MFLIASSAAMALLGLSASALAAPQHLSRETAPNQLSLTAQLTLADSAADRYNLLSKDSDFVYDWNKPDANVFATRISFPALVGTGFALSYAVVPPCAFPAIHVHPRANELVTVVEGRLTNYMIPESGVVNADGTIRVVTNELSSGMAILNPQGALHTLYNYDCEPVKAVAAFDSDDEGITAIPSSLFAAPDAVVGGQLGGVSDEQIDNLRALIKANRFLIEECQKKCNGTMRRH